MTPVEEPVIELSGVSRVYPGPPRVTAPHEAWPAVRRGECLAVVGPSGSGKSTLLGLLDRPSAGAYRLDGVDVAGLPERDRTALRGRRIGFVFQSFHLLPHRTAAENVMLAQVYNGTPRRQRRSAALAALDRVEVGHRAFALPTTLSGGERQRVAIARALVNAPAILLCAEPTGNLDSANSRRLLALFDELHAAGLTIVVITHAADVAQRAQRVVSIVDGRLSESAAAPSAPARRCPGEAPGGRTIRPRPP